MFSLIAVFSAFVQGSRQMLVGNFMKCGKNDDIPQEGIPREKSDGTTTNCPDSDNTPVGRQPKATHKMDCLVINCALCSKNFSDDLCPRTLQCGHSLCTFCAEKCLGSQKLCPECQEKQLVSNVKELPINYPLLRLMRSLGEEESGMLDLKVPVFPNDIPPTDMKLDMVKCDAHGNPIAYLCCTCSAWVCEDCFVVDHPYLPRGSCRILGLNDAIKQIRIEHKKTSDIVLKEIENMKKAFDSVLGVHDFCLKYCSKEKKGHLYLIKQTEDKLEELKKSNNLAVEQAKENVKKWTDLVETSSSPEELTTSCQKLLDCQNDFKSEIQKDQERTLPVSNIMRRHLRLEVRMLVERRTPVYAVTEENGKTMWAHLTIKRDRLLLYSLNEGKPPMDGNTIPFEYIKKLIPEPNATVFFEVGTAEEDMGRLFVRLSGNTALTQQMVLMCTGEKSVSYKGTHFYKRDDKEEILNGGDYENNDGTGGRPIVKGLGDCDTDAAYQRAHGAMVSDNISTRFHFHLGNIKGYIEGIVGKVTEGLKLLKSLSKLEPVTKGLIRECGIFIPMNVDIEIEESEEKEQEQEDEEDQEQEDEEEHEQEEEEEHEQQEEEEQEQQEEEEQEQQEEQEKEQQEEQEQEQQEEQEQEQQEEQEQEQQEEQEQEQQQEEQEKEQQEEEEQEQQEEHEQEQQFYGLRHLFY